MQLSCFKKEQTLLREALIMIMIEFFQFAFRCEMKERTNKIYDFLKMKQHQRACCILK